MRRALAAALALVVLAVACGDDADDAAEAERDGSRPQQEQQDEERQEQERQEQPEQEDPADSAAGVGDPYFPGLGNAGYDVDHYTLDLEYDPATNVLGGAATIDAEATAPLSAFNLDLVGMEVASVTVDGADAEFERDDAELVVTPSESIAEGDSFSTVVTYAGEPDAAVADSLGIEVGWVETDDGAYVLSEPDGARTWYPVNDHPSDKATYTFELTVPEPLTAAANGILTDQSTGDGKTTFVWKADDPMASYLVEVAVGEFVIDDAGTVGDVVIRNVFAAGLAERAGDAADQTPEMLEFFSAVWGPYPFDAYGILVVDVALGVALETQTLSLFGADTCCLPGSDAILAHELAHQWFGDAVSPARWQDIWLNEGFATYAEWMWAEHADGIPIEKSAERAYEARSSAEQERPILDPGPDGLFGGAVYQRGALTLYALQMEVGESTFDEIMRTYFERFNGESVTTQDFVDVAEEVSGDDLEALFDPWLTELELPPFPDAPPVAV